MFLPLSSVNSLIMGMGYECGRARCIQHSQGHRTAPSPCDIWHHPFEGFVLALHWLSRTIHQRQHPQENSAETRVQSQPSTRLQLCRNPIPTTNNWPWLYANLRKRKVCLWTSPDISRMVVVMLMNKSGLVREMEYDPSPWMEEFDV